MSLKRRRVNVYRLAEFQQYFPQVTPLVLDHNFTLMRSLDVWQAPFHLLLKGDKKLFAGDADATPYQIHINHAGVILSRSEQLH